METFEVNIEKRETTGKSATRKIKNEGLVPGVIYSGGEVISVSLDEDQLRHILTKHGDDIYFDAKFSGDSMKVKIQEVQRNPVSMDIIHIDLMPADKSDNISRILH